MIYLDNAATTPVLESVLDAMAPYLRESYGNPSSIHQAGRQARQAVDRARRTIANWLGCDPHDLLLTSGGTEANAAALTGTFLAQRATRPHIVTSAIEHHAVLHTLEFLQSLGAHVTRLPVDRQGRVSVEDVIAALRPDTGLVSIMAVNNEIGTIQPIESIAQAVKNVDSGIVVHSDMVQALPFIQHPLTYTKVDLASFSAHKIHGPKGVGALYLRKHIPWVPLLYGGGQEGRRRGGTENVAGIVGFAAAIDHLQRHFTSSVETIRSLRDHLWHQLQASTEVKRLSPVDGSPTILNVAFPGVRNDMLLMRLDLEGIAASAGSACTAGSLEPSHVIEACGHEAAVAEAIRFSVSDFNTMEEVEQASRLTANIVRDLKAHANEVL